MNSKIKISKQLTVIMLVVALFAGSAVRLSTRVVKAETNIDSKKLTDFLERYTTIFGLVDFYEGHKDYDDRMLINSFLIALSSGQEYIVSTAKVDTASLNYFGKKISSHRSLPPLFLNNGYYEMPSSPSTVSEISGSPKIEPLGENLYEVALTLNEYELGEITPTKTYTGTAIIAQNSSSTFGFNLLCYYVGTTPPKGVAEQINNLSSTRTEGTTPPPAPTRPQYSALPNIANATVDGRIMEFSTYNIEGYNYFNLRQVASALRGTAAQFNVGFDTTTNSVTISTGIPYEATGFMIDAFFEGNEVQAQVSTSTVLIDGSKVDLSVYTINDTNFFKLRDLAEKLNFKVDYNVEKKLIEISTMLENSNNPTGVATYNDKADVTLTGVVEKETWFHEGRNQYIDAYILRLDTPANFNLYDPATDESVIFKNIEEIDVSFGTSNNDLVLTKHISVMGKLFAGHTIYHRRPVVIIADDFSIVK